MHDGQSDHHQALTELRVRLKDGLARARLNKTQVAGRAGLGRTTVSEVFQTGGPVPSAETVAALARALALPAGQLLQLRRVAAESDAPLTVRSGPGRPIGEWEPHDLEVHPAGGASTNGSNISSPGRLVLPRYVRRGHDRVLDTAVQDAEKGRSRMLVLVGTSSTGKTRACWEAVQPLSALGWRLWHPFDPTRTEAALEDLHRVRPRTVVWLNEAQEYLGKPGVGERIAAAIHTLLIQVERGPVLVLGTLWPEFAIEYTTLPKSDEPDPHSRARELLAGRTLAVPEVFDELALAEAAVFADEGDRLLADALSRTRADGRLTQDLAGAPELLNRYEHGTPAARALLEAAMDARRLGVGLNLPQDFLADAAIDYLSDVDYEHLTEDWKECAFTDLSLLGHGKTSPLRRVMPRPELRPSASTQPLMTLPAAGPMFRLADYLEQHGRNTRQRLCPRASFWHAALTHLTQYDDLVDLGQAAENRYRLQWAHHLRQKAVRLAGIAPRTRPKAVPFTAGQNIMKQEEALDRDSAGDREGAEDLARQAAQAGDTMVWYFLGLRREGDGDAKSAEILYRQGVDAGNTHCLCRLALLRWNSGDPEGAEVLARQAADAGDTGGLELLTLMREAAGDREGAEDFAREAAAAGDTWPLQDMAMTRQDAGDREGAEALFWQAVHAGSTGALVALAELREGAGDKNGAEDLARQAADAGNAHGLVNLAGIREEAGDHQSSESLLLEAADSGRMPNALPSSLHTNTERWPYGLDADGTPSSPWQLPDDGHQKS